jgi:hypothetical protein
MVFNVKLHDTIQRYPVRFEHLAHCLLPQGDAAKDCAILCNRNRQGVALCAMRSGTPSVAWPPKSQCVPLCASPRRLSQLPG